MCHLILTDLAFSMRVCIGAWRSRVTIFWLNFILYLFLSFFSFSISVTHALSWHFSLAKEHLKTHIWYTQHQAVSSENCLNKWHQQHDCVRIDAVLLFWTLTWVETIEIIDSIYVSYVLCVLNIVSITVKNIWATFYIAIEEIQLMQNETKNVNNKLIQAHCELKSNY